MTHPDLTKLQLELGLSNRHQLPEITKIVVSAGIGQVKDPAQIKPIIADLAAITGQRPVLTRAKKSIASFKVRKNDLVGLTLNLRGKRMYNFLDKLIKVVLPAIRDFRGLSTKAFDQRGNLTIGLKEYSVFPEISYQTSGVSYGLEITVVIKAYHRDHAIALLKAWGLPIRLSPGS